MTEKDQSREAPAEVELHYFVEGRFSEAEEEALRVSKGVEELRLPHRTIQSVDLTPLSSCTMLRTLDLTENQLQAMDLTPLSSCTKLQTLDLTENQLQAMDLTPLSCTNLQTLNLGKNQLKSIDLTPLSSCTKLHTLDLRENQLQAIDLTPLSLCTMLHTLGLGENQLQAIDLTPLSSCTELLTLYLYHNQLQSIDLTPLLSCTKLLTLDLTGNQLQVIDLGPLSSCTKLQTLGLGGNQLQTTDLTPLSSCTKLQTLYLNENQLQAIDLTPLSSCTVLQTLGLSRNLLKRVNLTPLILCSSLDYLEIKWNQADSSRCVLSYDTLRLIAPVVAYEAGRLRGGHETDRVSHADLDVLIRFVEGLSGGAEQWKSHAVVQAILSGLGLAWLGLLDADPLAVMTLIKNSDPTEAATDSIIGLLCNQIDAGGTTIGLDVDRMIEHRALSIRIPEVLKLRKSEMNKVKVRVEPGGMTDLRALWLTAHGHSVLSVMQLGTKCSRAELAEVKDSLGKLGFSPEVTDGELAAPTNLSQPLRKYIWRKADLKESWKQIALFLRGRES